MAGLRAALFKDWKLFFRKTGLVSLLLPLALLLALQLGLSDSGRQAYLQPFPVAVRDEDDTLMSRSLLSQMERTPLFTRLIRPENGESDARLLEQGAAAVVTIPKDFFYDLYDMEDCPVQVTLNQAMPLEASLFRAMFCSVMEIIRSDQAAWQGLYAFRFGELTEEQRQSLYAEAADSLIQDALGRQTLFDDEQIPALEHVVEQRLLASLLAVGVLFFALSAVKTLPEELALGVLPRFRAAGCSLPAFLCAKLLTALAAVLPTLLLAALLLGGAGLGALLLAGLVLLMGAFGLLTAAAAWSGTAAAQRWGNLLILLSLVLGGVFWPVGLLPAPLALLGRLTLPYYGLLGVDAACRGVSALELLRLMLPVLLLGGAGFAVSLPGLRRRGAARQAPVSPAASEEAPSAPVRGLPFRLAGMAGVKLRAMSGGLGGLALLLAGALLCGAAAASVQNGGADRLRVAVCDLDNSASSRELVERLSRMPELSLTLCGEEEGGYLLLQGEAEGFLLIGRGYEEALRGDRRTPALRYTEAASAVTGQGVREIIAGQAAVQHSRLRAIRLAEQGEGPLDESGLARLMDCIAQAEGDAPLLYTIETVDGAPLPEPFLPSPMGFAALAVLFTLLTAAPWSGEEGRRISRRLCVLPYGRMLAWGSDCLALTALGFLTALAVLLPAGAVRAVPAALAYAFCAASLAQALVRFTAMEGRVDGFAPFLALFLCLLGGCFLDLSQLAPVFRGLSLLTPPGLAIRAAAGDYAAGAALLVLGGLCLRIAVPGRKRL